MTSPFQILLKWPLLKVGWPLKAPSQVSRLIINKFRLKNGNKVAAVIWWRAIKRHSIWWLWHKSTLHYTNWGLTLRLNTSQISSFLRLRLGKIQLTKDSLPKEITYTQLQLITEIYKNPPILTADSYSSVKKQPPLSCPRPTQWHLDCGRNNDEC